MKIVAVRYILSSVTLSLRSCVCCCYPILVTRSTLDVMTSDDAMRRS